MDISDLIVAVTENTTGTIAYLFLSNGNFLNLYITNYKRNVLYNKIVAKIDFDINKIIFFSNINDILIKYKINKNNWHNGNYFLCSYINIYDISLYKNILRKNKLEKLYSKISK